MSGCAHIDQTEFCAACAPEKLRLARDWMRNVADALRAAMPPDQGTKDLTLRTLTDLIAQIIVERDELRAKYAAALTVLRDRDLYPGPRPSEDEAREAYERIRADLEAR